VVTVLGIAVAAVLVWLVVASFWLWRNQERVVFQPPGIVVETPAPARRVEFLASDGTGLYGLLVEPSSPAPAGRRAPKTLVIAFHGNADLAAWLVPWAVELARRADVTVFIPEYRGYGGIPGTPTYETAASDALGALAFARRDLAPARLVLFGHSLGSALASDLAATMARTGDRADALVLQSPFTSARDMATRMLVPPIPGLWRRITRVHYDTRNIVAALDTPVWVSHGALDVIIPVRMGRAVYGAARRHGELLVVDRAGHNDVPDAGGERYWRWLTAAVSPPLVELEEERRGRLPGLV